MTRFVLFLFFFFLSVIPQAQEKSIVRGMKITASTSIKKAIYKLDAPGSLTSSIILVEGKDITIDFSGVTINGSNKAKQPDEFFGVAILVQNSTNVKIKNLTVKGFKIALLARNVTGLVLEGCDFSYNYRPHLNSSQEKEDISDWMSYHHNEKDEWMRYGAAIYLRGCEKAIIRNCKVTGGQNALMMTGCDDGNIEGNDFSFNSGIGIGMYRCNRNTILNNRLIFNVRGYSHGVYNRGQDSAGILVYEQSNNNIFYGNNVTHGGDGFFLWAGQTTMDKGVGGCNDNLIANNDFSYAPTNGIEVTFSSNAIFNNRMFECDYGIWGGYSYNTTIKGNQFRNNRIGIAIEHGQHNVIENNLFIADKQAIHIWSNKLEPSSWGYPKYRDTRSAAYKISINSFHDNEVVFNLARTDSLWIHDNTIEGKISNYFKIDSTITRLDSVYEDFPAGSSVVPVTFEIKGKNSFEGSGKFRGRDKILITQWGPYDYRYPIIWNTNPKLKYGNMKFDLLGPKGKWRVIKFKGVENLSAMSGEFPSTLVAKKFDSAWTDVEIELEYTGETFVNAFGRKMPASKPHRFYFRKYFKPIDWEVEFFTLDTAIHNPIKTGELFSALEKKAPVIIEGTDRIDYAWWGGIKAGTEKYKQFITMAEGTARFAKGAYELSVTWDDAVRVYVDEKLVIDEWKPSLYSFDESPHKKIRLELGGEHRFRVEHVELGGFATLALKIRPIE